MSSNEATLKQAGWCQG